MYLSRIELNAKNIQTRRALASPQLLHAAVEGCFPNGEKIRRNLWRIDRLKERLYLLLLSPESPDFTQFAIQFCSLGTAGETRPYQAQLDNILEGQQYRFRLCANPVHSKQTEQGARGKVYPHVTIFYKRAWLMQRAEKKGFTLKEEEFDVTETRNARFYRNGDSKPVELSIATYEGILEVLNAERLRQALTDGIGRAKAYGCGLMTITSPWP